MEMICIKVIQIIKISAKKQIQLTHSLIVSHHLFCLLFNTTLLMRGDPNLVEDIISKQLFRFLKLQKVVNSISKFPILIFCFFVKPYIVTSRHPPGFLQMAFAKFGKGRSYLQPKNRLFKELHLFSFCFLQDFVECIKSACCCFSLRVFPMMNSELEIYAL